MSEPVKRNPPPSGSVRLAVSGTIADAGNWASVFWFDSANSGGLDIPSVQALGEDLYAIWKTHLLPLISEQTEVTKEVCTFYGDAGLVIAGETDHTDPGGDATTDYAAQRAIVISWQLGSTWRGGKPRTYLVTPSGLPAVDPAHISVASAATLHDAALAMLTGWNAVTTSKFTSVTFGCLRFYAAHAALAPPTFLPAIGVKVNTRFDTMRRRLGK